MVLLDFKQYITWKRFGFMYRFYLLILLNMFRIPRLIRRLNRMVRRKDQYTPEERHFEVRRTINMVKTASMVRTKVYGTENLPAEGGYIMYANHQGKYDACGVFWAHEKPFSVIMDEKKSHMILTRQIMALCDGKTLVLNDPRSGLRTILEMAEETAKGKKFLIFPEGGYMHNKNELQEFKAGAFKASVKSKSPIVPVALVDSYRVYEGIEFGIITTEVHFLPPMYYEDYKSMNTQEIAEKVSDLIAQKVNESLENRKNNKKPFFI